MKATMMNVTMTALLAAMFAAFAVSAMMRSHARLADAEASMNSAHADRVTMTGGR